MSGLRAVLRRRWRAILLVVVFATVAAYAAASLVIEHQVDRNVERATAMFEGDAVEV